MCTITIVQREDGNRTDEPANVPLTLYSGNHLMTIDQQSRRHVTLTLHFKFNAAKSNYKGTGAGEGQKSRM